MSDHDAAWRCHLVPTVPLISQQEAKCPPPQMSTNFMHCHHCLQYPSSISTTAIGTVAARYPVRPSTPLRLTVGEVRTYRTINDSPTGKLQMK